MRNPSFKVRARVLNQLGDQLIKNESIALLELIKNSYDADASLCNIEMRRPDCTDRGEIIIEDDGEGMDYETLTSAWLEIGTSYKDDLREHGSSRRSRKYKRLRLGEKGIGRFGVHRLGRQIEIITRKEKCDEFVLKVNWDDIEKTKYVEELPIVIKKRNPQTFKNSTGTKIFIRRLRQSWTRKMARDCARVILSLNSPFDSNDSFRTKFTIVHSDWLDGLLTFEDIEQYKLFYFDIKMSGSEIVDFVYEFIPWKTMKKLSPRRITIRDKEIKSLTRMVFKSGRNYQEIDLSKYSIGTIRFKGIIFDRDSRVLSLGVQDKMGLKKYLDVNGGIKVFRDNMRILDYGEQGNDWLDLGGRRINMPTRRISNNIILAAVYLNHEKSTDLKEKANREGFIENEAYWEFWRAIRFAIDRVESLRKTDKDLIRKFYGPQKTSEPVVTSISDLKDFVESNVKDADAKEKINRYLDRIEGEYQSLTDSLIKSAGAGLNLIVVIHQIEKILKELRYLIKSKSPTNLLEEKIRRLSALVEGYSILIKKSEKKSRDLKHIVEQSIFNVEFRLEAHSIKLDPAFRKRKMECTAVFAEGHVLNALMNIFDNSIWWLGYSKTKNATVYIDISDQFPGHISIVIADNGPGFTKPTEEIVKPFVSDKPGGMGIGLHLTQQIMESLGGILLFPEMEWFDIPKKYANGAKIALAFKKK